VFGKGRKGLPSLNSGKRDKQADQDSSRAFVTALEQEIRPFGIPQADNQELGRVQEKVTQEEFEPVGIQITQFPHFCDCGIAPALPLKFAEPPVQYLHVMPSAFVRVT